MEIIGLIDDKEKFVKIKYPIEVYKFGNELREKFTGMIYTKLIDGQWKSNTGIVYVVKNNDGTFCGLPATKGK